MERFFIPPTAIQGERAVITGEDVAHIARVLRLQPGDEITLCDGMRHDYAARITAMDKESVFVTLLNEIPSMGEPEKRYTLYQALPKAGKMETIIQKCVELGVCAMQPYVSARCVVKPDGFDKKLQRYRRVAYEAAKQSRRGILPEVLPLLSLMELDFSRHDLVLFAYELEQDRTLKQALCDAVARDIAFVIGPEGGFTPEEADALCERGAIRVSLGSRILRTETAGMAMLAMLAYALE